MAINVNTVYTTVLSILNKEQRGYLTPDEFNKTATQVQLEIFENLFADYSQFLRMPKLEAEFASKVDHAYEEIQFFEETDEAESVEFPNIYKQPGSSGVLTTTITNTGVDNVDGLANTFSITGSGSGCVVDIFEQGGNINTITITEPGLGYKVGDRVGIISDLSQAEFEVTSLTTGVYRLGSVYYVDYPNNTEISILDKRGYNQQVLSPILQPSKNFPIATYQKDKLTIYPPFPTPNKSDVLFNYIRKPKNVVWAYGIGDLDQYIWDQVYTGASVITPSSGSQNFELSETFQTQVILEILKYTGLIIKDPQVIQAAAQELQANEVNEKR